MAQFGIKIVYFLSILCLVGTVSMEMSVDLIYEVLSSRIENVIHETNKIKSGLEETKATVNKIETKIGDIQAYVVVSMTDVKKSVEAMSESLINEKIKDVENRSESQISVKIKIVQDMSESLINDKIKKQSVAVRKMLYTEKILLREVVQEFEKDLTTFQTDIRSRMTLMNGSITLMNGSMERSVDLLLEQSMTQHKKETNTSLVLMNTELQNMMNETGQQIKGMNTKLRNMIEDSDIKTELAMNKIENETNFKMKQVKQDMEEQSKVSMEKINDVSQSILTSTSSNLQTAKSEINFRLNTAESQLSSMSSKVTSLERQQGKRVAFLARGATKQSDGTVRFSQVHLNEGSAYDSTSGVFTCQTEGLYQVTANMIEHGSGDNKIHCYITKSGSSYLEMYSWPGSIDGKRATDGYGAATGSGTFHLLKGDRVYVSCTSNTRSSLYHSSFSGVLINPDP